MRDEATVDAALCRRYLAMPLSDDGAAWRLISLDRRITNWRVNCPIYRQLSKITKLPLETWCDYRPNWQYFFLDGWRHKAIDAELESDLRLLEKRATARQSGLVSCWPA